MNAEQAEVSTTAALFPEVGIDRALIR